MYVNSILIMEILLGVKEMSIRIQNNLPAKAILENENILLMDENRSTHQDIRPNQSEY